MIKKKSIKKKAPSKSSETAEDKAEFLRFLNMARDTEKEGLKFYVSVKQRIDDYNMNQLITVIMEQEKEHLRIVTEVYNAEKSKGIEEAAKKAAGYRKQKPIKTPLNAMKHLDETVKKKMTIYSLFKKAVEFEEGISKLYTDLAAKTKNAKVKQLFSKLAAEELGHKEFIMAHQDSIYNDGHWYGWEHVRLQT